MRPWKQRGGKPEPTQTLSAAEVERRYGVMRSLPARPRSYDLLFELGTDRLTPASQELLKKAIAEIKNFPPVNSSSPAMPTPSAAMPAMMPCPCAAPA
jgi:hypothetical protein